MAAYYIKITNVETGEVEISEAVPAEEAIKFLKASIEKEDDSPVELDDDADPFEADQGFPADFPGF